MILFDLDHLKRINDTYGHQMGDRVLRHVAEAMHVVARSTDILCRYAGDEFVLILPGTEKHEAATLAERLRVCVHQPVILGEGLRVIPWTANSRGNWERLVRAGVDGVITDDPAGLIAFLRAKGLRA